MDQSWLLDYASRAWIWESHAAATVQPGTAETGTSFQKEIERILGEDAEPDAAFFIDCWSSGAAEASENFVRRRNALKSSACQLTGWSNRSSFVPIGTDKTGASTVGRSTARKEYHEVISFLDQRQDDREQQDDMDSLCDSETLCPLTVESAYRLLGISATSSRNEIRTAYRKLASRYHPDLLARSGARAQKMAANRMASINDAYRLLRTQRA